MGLVHLAAEEILIDRNKHVGHQASSSLCQIHPCTFTLTYISSICDVPSFSRVNFSWKDFESWFCFADYVATFKLHFKMNIKVKVGYRGETQAMWTERLWPLWVKQGKQRTCIYIRHPGSFKKSSNLCLDACTLSYIIDPWCSHSRCYFVIIVLLQTLFSWLNLLYLLLLKSVWNMAIFEFDLKVKLSLKRIT